MYKPPLVTKIFLKSEMLWVKTFQIVKVNTNKTSVTCTTPKTIHCLILALSTTNAVLDPNQAQPSWYTWPKEQLCCSSSLISCARTSPWFITKSPADRITVDSIITEWNSDILYAPALYDSRSVFQEILQTLHWVEYYWFTNRVWIQHWH